MLGTPFPYRPPRADKRRDHPERLPSRCVSPSRSPGLEPVATGPRSYGEALGGERQSTLYEAVSTTFAGDDDNFTRYACNSLRHAHMIITGRPDPKALTVKTTVPTPCTPPFPKNQHAKRAP
jgi:hypothetical protein